MLELFRRRALELLCALTPIGNARVGSASLWPFSSLCRAAAAGVGASLLERGLAPAPLARLGSPPLPARVSSPPLAARVGFAPAPARIGFAARADDVRDGRVSVPLGRAARPDWGSATRRSSFCGLPGQSQCVEWRSAQSVGRFRSVQTARRREAGGSPPQKMAPWCLAGVPDRQTLGRDDLNPPSR